MSEISIQKKLQHLYWRAGIGPALDLNTTNTSVKKEVDKIFSVAKEYTAIDVVEFDRPTRMEKQSMSDEERKKMLREGKAEKFVLGYACILKMVEEKNVLREKMAFFWSNHFACKINEPNFAQNYINVIRENALGKFSDLLTAVSKTAGMLQYLNNNQNKKRSPNENFAREVMELFTLGRGNYSEQDVKESARAFTGWSFDKTGEFRLRIFEHDDDTKTFLGKTGNFNGDDILKMIIEKKQCANFITRKIYRNFVNDKPDEAIIEKLADVFYLSNYDIEKLMQTIFSAEWFYDQKNIGVKIKSPIDLLAGMMQLYNVRFTDTSRFLAYQRALGQELFQPPNVAGWPVDKGWIDNATLMLRLKMPEWLFEKKHFNIPTKATYDVQQAQLRNKDEKQDLITFDFSKFENTFANIPAEQQIKAIANFLLVPESSNNVSTAINNNTQAGEKIKSITLKVMA